MERADRSSHQLIPLRQRAATVLLVILPFLGLLLAGVLFWGQGFGWVEVALLASMYFLTGLGITVGFHRLFTHRSFETSRVVQLFLCALGSMAVQGPLLKWVAVHRRHHQHSDGHEDPHTPHHHGSGLWGLLGGLWHAHVGWLFKADTRGLSRYIIDLRKNRLLCRVSALFPLWVIVGLLVPAAIGLLLMGGWMGALQGLLWGGLVRIFLLQHMTWSVNSVCHLWGRQPYPGRDHSKNNFLFGVLAIGEGWHNNHHAFPTSARHGIHWWQLDASFWVIRALAALGLAWNLRLPPAQPARAVA